jgi:hypothetical protein
MKTKEFEEIAKNAIIQIMKEKYNIELTTDDEIYVDIYLKQANINIKLD